MPLVTITKQAQTAILRHASTDFKDTVHPVDEEHVAVFLSEETIKGLQEYFQLEDESLSDTILRICSSRN